MYIYPQNKQLDYSDPIFEPCIYIPIWEADKLLITVISEHGSVQTFIFTMIYKTF